VTLHQFYESIALFHVQTCQKMGMSRNDVTDFFHIFDISYGHTFDVLSPEFKIQKSNLSAIVTPYGFTFKLVRKKWCN